jgi:DNA polymerase
MTDPQRNPEEVGRHLRITLESLRSAGVEWLPTAALPESVNGLPGLESATSPEAEKTEDRSAGRLAELKVLAAHVAECQRCSHLASTRTQTVFGIGPLQPELCFVGEAPGRQEDERGQPFVGDAGQLLDRILAACGMKREDVYICNIIKCRPPGNRQPNPEEAGNCREFLLRQIALVQPKFLCALGATAANNLLGNTTPIGKLRGRFHEFQGIPLLCTYHPAYLLRSPEKKRDVWEDMKILLAKMGRQVPGS